MSICVLNWIVLEAGFEIVKIITPLPTTNPYVKLFYKNSDDILLLSFDCTTPNVEKHLSDASVEAV